MAFIQYFEIILNLELCVLALLAQIDYYLLPLINCGENLISCGTSFILKTLNRPLMQNVRFDSVHK